MDKNDATTWERHDHTELNCLDQDLRDLLANNAIRDTIRDFNGGDKDKLFIERLRHKLSSKEILWVIAVIETTCCHCWDGDKNCRCWDDE
jgi:hypothetical protein